MKILVTGITSLAGWHVFSLAAENHTVLGTHNEKTKPVFSPNVERLNIVDPKAVRSLVQSFLPNVIIHCSAICALGHCEKAPDRAHEVNVVGTRNLLDASEEVGARFLFLSTDLVFDGKNPPYDENHSPSPLSQYGRTKVQAEDLVLSSSLNYLMVRAALSFGFSVQGTKGPSDWIFNRVAHGRPVTLYIDEFRSPMEAGWLAEVLLDLAKSSLKGVVHVGGAEKVSRYELGCRLLERKGLPKEILIPGSRLKAPWPPRPHDLTFDCRKLYTVRHQPMPPLKESLDRLYPL